MAWLPQYEMVKENETIEARHERAKVIVDMELLWPNGMWFLRPHQYDTYLHILTNKHSGVQLSFTSCGTQVFQRFKFKSGAKILPPAGLQVGKMIGFHHGRESQDA